MAGDSRDQASAARKKAALVAANTPKPYVPPKPAAVTAADRAKAMSTLPDYAKPGYQGQTYTRPDGSQGNYALEAQNYTKYYSPSAQAAQMALPPIGGGSGGGAGGGYGGGGGGGGGAAGLDKAAYNAYAQAMMQLINGGFQAPAAQTNPLTRMIDPAVDKDIAAARGAYANIGNEVSMVDPYLAMLRVQMPHSSAELQALANSQGVGDPYRAQVGASNLDADQASANWQQLARALGGNFKTGQQNAVDTAKLQGQNIVEGYEGQRTQLQALAALQQQKLDQQHQADVQAMQQQKLQALMQLLGTGLQYGVTPDVSGVA